MLLKLEASLLSGKALARKNMQRYKDEIKKKILLKAVNASLNVFVGR